MVHLSCLLSEPGHPAVSTGRFQHIMDDFCHLVLSASSDLEILWECVAVGGTVLEQS